MQQTKKYLRFAVALTCLTSAFLLSVSIGDRGLLVDLRQSSGAARRASCAPIASYSVSAASTDTACSSAWQAVIARVDASVGPVLVSSHSTNSAPKTATRSKQPRT